MAHSFYLLSERSGVPVFHLDQYTAKAGWKWVPEATFTQELADILQGDQWIVEGWAYDSTVRMRLEAADQVIHLDYPLWFCYWNALIRHVLYTFRPNPYDPPNSPIWQKTRRMVRAMWRVHTQYEPALREMLAEPGIEPKTLVFRRRKALKRWLKEEESKNN